MTKTKKRKPAPPGSFHIAASSFNQVAVMIFFFLGAGADYNWNNWIEDNHSDVLFVTDVSGRDSKTYPNQPTKKEQSATKKT
jgi:hypothetical protein